MSLSVVERTKMVIHRYKIFFHFNQKYKEHIDNVKTSQFRNYSSASTKRRAKKQKDNDILKIKNDYQSSVWTKALENNYAYIADKSVAREIASFVCKDSKDIFTFEARPGPGILTECLLEAGISKLRVFENEEAFLKPLEVLSDRFPHLEVIYNDVMYAHMPINKNKYTAVSGLDFFFKGVPTLSWTDGIPGNLIGIVLSRAGANFIRYMFVSLATMQSFFTHGRFQFFLLISEQEFSYLMAKPKVNFLYYKDATVLYNLLFDIEYFKKFPTASFLPRRSKNTSGSYLHMVKLTPKREMLTIVNDKEHLSHLYFFICHHLKRRTSYVISALEQWIPWCGPHLIKNGMHIFTRFGDLSPSQILTLFHQFSSFPEYKNSNIQEAIRNYYERFRMYNK